ncbi:MULTISPECIES: DUF4282 domain-containing protein [Robinsoniella]|uniref:DUF4282 domain-containing protein n=1 Tax=Robinsoniella TaxID=588605 RepID=UPI0005C7E487|nr:DUF4282 domain-containing protein [Robinsoniella peoriensis]
MDHYMSILKQFGVIMTVAGVIIGIIMSFVVFFAFMSKKNVNRFHGFFGWLYDYLQFKNFIIEGLLKFFYVLGACVCTTVGVFNILCLQMVLGFAVLIFGNLILRIFYEFALMIVVICRNVSEINKKMGGGVDHRTQFKECEIPPMPKKEDFVMRDPQKDAMRETAATQSQPVYQNTGIMQPQAVMSTAAPAANTAAPAVNTVPAANTAAPAVNTVPAANTAAPAVNTVPAANTAALAPKEVLSTSSTAETAESEKLSTEKSDIVDNSKKLCPSCGNEGGELDAFCSRCGRKY